MVEKIDQLLNNSQMMQQFSINSIEYAQQFNEINVSTKWQNIFKLSQRKTHFPRIIYLTNHVHTNYMFS